MGIRTDAAQAIARRSDTVAKRIRGMRTAVVMLQALRDPWDASTTSWDVYGTS